MRRRSDRGATLESLFEEVASKQKRSSTPKALLDRGATVVARTVERILNTPIKSDGTKIVTASAFSETLLRDLFEHRICGIHIPNYCAEAQAIRIREWIL